VPPAASTWMFLAWARTVTYRHNSSGLRIRSRRSLVLNTQCTRLCAYVCDIGLNLIGSRVIVGDGTHGGRFAELRPYGAPIQEYPSTQRFALG
jgi:hypothetical protein